MPRTIRSQQFMFDALDNETEHAADMAAAEVEALHADLYPNGCPNRCEACGLRLGDKRCERCGAVRPVGQSCGCFDNNGQ